MSEGDECLLNCSWFNIFMHYLFLYIKLKSSIMEYPLKKTTKTLKLYKKDGRSFNINLSQIVWGMNSNRNELDFRIYIVYF